MIYEVVAVYNVITTCTIYRTMNNLESVTQRAVVAAYLSL